MKKTLQSLAIAMVISVINCFGQVPFYKGDGNDISNFINVKLDPTKKNSNYTFNLSTPSRLETTSTDSYGIPEKVSYKIKNENRSSSWVVEIKSENAISLDVYLTDIDIQEGSEIYLYNSDQSTVMGPVNVNNIHPELKHLSTVVFEGNTLYIQINEGEGNATSFTVSQIVHGVKQIGNFEKLDEKTDPEYDIMSIDCIPSATCHYNNWGLQIEATGRILYGGAKFGSGTFLNNELQDRTPYFLTAFHVLDTDGNGSLSVGEKAAASSCNIVIDFRRITCVGTIMAGTSLTGAVFRSAWNSTDFALIELLTIPPIGLRVNYAGWNRSGSTPNRGHVLHHPEAEHMRYSSSTNLGIRVYPLNWNYFEIFNFDEGFTTSGSSGGALYNDSRQVIGQLKGGLPQNDCNNLIEAKHFGRFYDSWDGGGTSDTQLKHWLSPTNNYSSLETLDPLRFSNANYTVCYGTNTTITLPHVIPGESASWSVSSGISIVSSTYNSITVTATNPGTNGPASVTATFGAEEITKHVWYGVPSSVTGTMDGWPVSYPQPCSTASRLAVNGQGIVNCS